MDQERDNSHLPNLSTRDISDLNNGELPIWDQTALASYDNQEFPYATVPQGIFSYSSSSTDAPSDHSSRLRNTYPLQNPQYQQVHEGYGHPYDFGSGTTAADLQDAMQDGTGFQQELGLPYPNSQATVHMGGFIQDGNVQDYFESHEMAREIDGMHHSLSPSIQAQYDSQGLQAPLNLGLYHDEFYDLRPAPMNVDLDLNQLQLGHRAPPAEQSEEADEAQSQGPQRETIVCEYCNKSFKPKGISRHKNQAHKIPPPKIEYNCPRGCPRSFSTSRDLKRHESIHDPEREAFYCPIYDCGKEYTRKEYVARHVKKSHTNMDMKI